MRGFHLFLVFFITLPLSMRAAWTLESSKQLPTRDPGVHHEVRSLSDGRSVQLHLVKFDRSQFALRVLNLEPDSTVASTVRSHGGLAGVNGGYFKPDQSPLGVVVSQGVKLHPLEKSKILTGVLVVTAHGANLLRTAEFQQSLKPSKVREALQAGPFLVDHGKAVAGLNDKRAAERTALLADKNGVAALLITQPLTLAELARILSTPGIFPGLDIERALNLDGGSSTALWVDGEPDAFSHREWKPVRNAVAVVPKSGK